MRRFVSYAALIGGLLPLMIFAISHAGLITATWWHSNIIYVWPTFYIMLGFAGPVDSATLLALGLSAFLNAVIYAAIACLIYYLLHGRKANPRGSKPRPDLE